MKLSLMISLTLFWLGSIIACFVFWEEFARSSGRTDPASRVTIESTPSRGWLLQAFFHPHCPCSRVSLQNLAELLEDARTHPEVRIWFVRPSSVPAGWEQSALSAQAREWFGSAVRTDIAGAEARNHGAKNSGMIILSDSRGKVFYRGGVARGGNTFGNNEGKRMIRAILDGEIQEPKRFPVFGCQLLDPIPAGLLSGGSS